MVPSEYIPPAKLLSKLTELHFGAYKGDAFVKELPDQLSKVKSLKKIRFDTTIDYVGEDTISELLENNKLEVISVENNAMLQRILQQTKNKIKNYKRINYFLAGHEIVWDFDARKLVVTIQNIMQLEPLSLDGIEFESIEIIYKSHSKENPLSDWIALIGKSKLILKNIVITGYDVEDSVGAIEKHIDVIREFRKLENLVLGISIPKSIDTAFKRASDMMELYIKRSPDSMRKIVFVRKEDEIPPYNAKQKKNMCGKWYFKSNGNQIACHKDKSFMKRLFSPKKKIA